MVLRSASGILLAACLGASAAGCGLLLGVSSWQDVACVDSCGADGSTDSTIPHDGTADASDTSQGDSNVPDGSGTDVSADALDSGSTSDGDAADPYHSITDQAFWTTFDVSTLDGGAKGFLGGAFDGRYVYLAPHGTISPSGVVTRLDTEADGGFKSRASWQTFDTTSIDGGAGASGFQGAVYDPVQGRLYLVPDNDMVPDGIVATYPTGPQGDAGLLPFSTASSWSTYAPVVGDGGNAGFAGGTFDGQHVYLVPSDNGAPDGIVTRVDTTQPFASAGSWSAFDMTQLKPRANHYLGAVYTGTLVLFAPTEQGAGAMPSGLVASYLASQAFGTPGNWQTFDVTGIPGGMNAAGFRGVAFDGKYAYFVPNASGTLHAEVARFDSSKAGGLTDTSAWEFFDATQQLMNAAATGFFGAAFDGRYIYLVPNANTLLVRYDTTITTTNAFTAASSWSTFDISALGIGKGPFAGAVFDGEYVYFVPQTGSVVSRFDARSPAAQVTGQTGSFF